MFNAILQLRQIWNIIHIWKFKKCLLHVWKNFEDWNFLEMKKSQYCKLCMFIF